MKRAISLITRNRPQYAARALESAITQIEKEGEPTEIFVFDQSDPQTSHINSDVIDGLQRASALSTLIHIDCVAKDRFISELATSSGIETEVIRMGIGSGVDSMVDAYGANRNTSTLMLAGRPFLSTDDDVCLTPHELSSKETGAAPRLLPWTIWATSPEMDVSRLIVPSKADLLRSLLDFCSGQSGSFEFTSCGVIGHSGLGNHASLARGLDEDALRRIFVSERAYERMVGGSQFVRISEQYRDWGFTGFLTTVYGCRNACALVPFVPEGRGEDHVLGEMTSRLYPQVRVAHLPLAVLHQPFQARPTSRGLFEIEVPHVWGAVTNMLIGSSPCSAQEFGTRLLQVSASPTRVRELLIEGVRRYCQQRADDLWLEALQWCGPPLGFAALDECASRWNEIERNLVDSGWPSEDSSRMGTNSWATRLNCFGHLLSAWRDLWHSAQRLAWG